MQNSQIFLGFENENNIQNGWLHFYLQTIAKIHWICLFKQDLSHKIHYFRQSLIFQIDSKQIANLLKTFFVNLYWTDLQLHFRFRVAVPRSPEDYLLTYFHTMAVTMSPAHAYVCMFQPTLGPPTIMGNFQKLFYLNWSNLIIALWSNFG